MSNDKTVMDLTSVEGIQVALESCKDSVMKGVLEALLKAKQREQELLAKKSSTKKFSDSELIAKNVFVAVRQQVIVGDSECSAVLAFNGAIKALNLVLDKELQENFFKSSVLHCGKSNLNKAKSVYEAIQNYKEAVRQSKLLLPLIEDSTWKLWEASMYEVAKNVIKKRGEVWKEPVQDEPETDEPETDEPETVPAKKVTVITTRKNGKRN